VPSPSHDEVPVFSDLELADRQVLVDIARHAVRAGLNGRNDWRPARDHVPIRLAECGATFVTLRRENDLLGCIGTMEPRRSLADDVAKNSIGAAFGDPRLPPVTWDDYAHMSVKISVLGPLVQIAVASGGELRRSVRVGVDGLLITAGRRRATFLPSVWEQVPDHDMFMRMLWEKAGLDAGDWPRTLEVFRYETVEFGD